MLLCVTAMMYQDIVICTLPLQIKPCSYVLPNIDKAGVSCDLERPAVVF